MENASKALLIAGSMLLMILVLTLAIYFFRNMAGQTSEFYDEMSENEISEFNQKYFNFDRRGTKKDAEGKWINPLTVQDVVTIINMAKNDNQEGKMPVTISVKLNEKDALKENITELLSNNKDGEEKIYSCKVDYADNSELVGKITITNL